MVLQSRLGYGFNGYQVPPTPRATRSPRRRDSIMKKVDDNPMCAFELLATVAGKLLLDGECPPSSSNTLIGKELSSVVKDSLKNEEQGEDNSSKVEPCEQGSCDRNFFVSDLVSQAPILHHRSMDFLHVRTDDCSGHASVITTSDCSEMVGSADKVVGGKSKDQLGSSIDNVEVASSPYLLKMETPNTSNVLNSTKVDMCSSNSPVVSGRIPSALVSVDSCINLPSYTDHFPSYSFPACRNDVKLVIRDDDENSSGCTQPGTTRRAFRPQPRSGDRRIRRLLASKYWKVTPRLKGEEQFNSDTKLVYHTRKTCYKRQRSQRDYPFKKRKLYDRSLVSNFGGGSRREGICSSPRKGFSCDASGSGVTLHGASRASACVEGQHASFQSPDSLVKLRIKSFKVPELFIEIPDTATVGSLKRTVMDAVTAMLGGGLRVGVLLQGKKIRDNNKTLLQTGICRDNILDALGFSLEPNPSQAPLPVFHEDHPLQLPSDSPQPLTRYPPAPSVVHNVVQQSAADALPDPLLTNSGNFVESDHDSAPSPPDMSIDKYPTDSRALVAAPSMNEEALAVVPMRKSKRSEVVQRRIRRPFSVSEVEALVQAVEMLGTGRWRDVKLRAFDNAKHRTYVDLKDKWKTLVHTARISPQQRRGEPVPQELLDRVLAAHAYWSQQQLKQQPETCLV